MRQMLISVCELCEILLMAIVMLQMLTWFTVCILYCFCLLFSCSFAVLVMAYPRVTVNIGRLNKL